MNRFLFLFLLIFSSEAHAGNFLNEKNIVGRYCLTVIFPKEDDVKVKKEIYELSFFEDGRLKYSSLSHLRGRGGLNHEYFGYYSFSDDHLEVNVNASVNLYREFEFPSGTTVEQLVKNPGVKVLMGYLDHDGIPLDAIFLKIENESGVVCQ